MGRLKLVNKNLVEASKKSTISAGKTAEEVYVDKGVEVDIIAETGKFKNKTVSQILDMCEDISLEECDFIATELAMSDASGETMTAGDLKALGERTAEIAATATFHGNPLFEGPTGVGKTSIVKQWAKQKGYEIVSVNLHSDTDFFTGMKDIDDNAEVDFGDGKKVKMPQVRTVQVATFNKLLSGNPKILFIDEINTAPTETLRALYDLISFHIVQNGDSVMYLPKLLFVVGAMNPITYGNRNQIDTALKNRFILIKLTYDLKGYKEFISSLIDKKLKQLTWSINNPEKAQAYGVKADVETLKRRCIKWLGIKDLAEHLLNSKEFRFSTPAEIDAVADNDTAGSVVPRSVVKALIWSDGTKDGFIDVISSICGPDGEKIIVPIMKGYRDKNHKANKIWDKDYSVKPEKHEETAEEKAAKAAEASGVDAPKVKSSDDDLAGTIFNGLEDELSK